jgi:hypothetical protein
MTALLPLFACSLLVLGILRSDPKDRAAVSWAVWLPVAWAVILASRPVTSWFTGTDQVISTPESYDEGNPAEAFIHLALMAVALLVLYRRRVHPIEVIRQNPWLAAAYGFWLLSAVWSDYPLITVKRLGRDLGTVAMVLIVLTELHPRQALRTVFTRCAYACIPLSFLLIRYAPDVGRTYGGYDHAELMYVGVATHKNALGALALVGALFLLWDFLEHPGRPKTSAQHLIRALRVAVLLTCWNLLIIADSVSSLVCAAMGSLLLLALHVPAVRGNPRRVAVSACALLLLLAVSDSVFALKERVVSSLGRDMTLTTRTDVWPVLLDAQTNSLLGAGFNTFWAGQRLTQLQETVGGIIQAHNGFLETYLHGGLIGLGLLVLLLSSSTRRRLASTALATAEGRIGLVILLSVIIHNFSEASFYKESLLWFALLCAIAEYRAPRRPAAPAPAQGRPRSAVA